MSAKLVAIAGPICGETFPIYGDETTIGRDVNAQLSIPDRLMSRRHCAVYFLPEIGCFTLVDLASANGTQVNGAPVRERVLEHGDRIRVGESLLLFVNGSRGIHAAADAPPRIDELTARIPTDVEDSERLEEAASGVSGTMGLPPEGGSHSAEATEDASRSDEAGPWIDMIGNSAAMRSVYERIRKAAPAACTVLISGETGTGKELAARAIHRHSTRASGPFVAVNCAALTESLLESELFGHEKGAFTGAFSLKKGKLELADGGTVFLDEIGELAPPLQAKVLRALQYHEFERVGGTRTIKVDVRVVAATNRDLTEAVQAGTFREDLWYRLNVLNVAMPPLRARRSDIPLLAAHFASRYGGRSIQISREALEALHAHDWPGNVRELENAIESAVVLGPADFIVADDLPRSIVGSANRLPPAAGAPYHRHVLDAKRQLILDAIERSGGRYTAAAKLLGLNPTYLHRLVRNLNLKDTARR
jgi:transcriptional regulator with GAF, ATPase, and Fis domain